MCIRDRLYAVRFIPQYGLLRGLWYALFHAISAFCNAGIDILGETSLQQYVADPYINVVTILIIVVSGLGFLVWKDLMLAASRLYHREYPLCRVIQKDVYKRQVMIFQAVCSLDHLKHRKLTIAVHFVIMILICASTVLLDQHSVIDVVCGAMMSFVLHGLVYQVEWRDALAASRKRRTLFRRT